jgi:peptidoglycan hydrolase-like protein with peptidoglycan-binding domain
LLHEALHIYFGTTVAHSGSTGNAQCYQRLMLRLNGIRVHALTVQRCPPNLRKGSRGGDVREAQLRLNRWITTSGASLSPLKVDGVFGPLVDAVVKEFQRKQGLTDDGVIGPRTWAALPAILPLQNGSKGRAVGELQRRLNLWIASGRRAGIVKLRIDGSFGAKTEAVTRAFQTAEGVSVNGIVNSLTWAHLPSD